MPVDWNEIRTAYEETREPLVEMAARFGVARSSISAHVRTDGWVRRNKPVVADAHVLVRRMYRLVDRWLVKMERADEPMGEKDAGVLNRMAATLERLMEIEARNPEQKKPGATKESAEMQQIRKIIARRLEQLGDF